MKTEFRASFRKDLKKIKSAQVLDRIREVIEHVEGVETISEINNLKKLRGSENYYRIRLGDFRIGLKIADTMVIFIRFLHRKEIYKYFP